MTGDKFNRPYIENIAADSNEIRWISLES